MTYVIAEPCIDVVDRACVWECPLDCIYESERALFIPARTVCGLRRVRAGAAQWRVRSSTRPTFQPAWAAFTEDDVPSSPNRCLARRRR